ncbi:MAG: hypothetical protein GTO54_09180 [Nitrososphaeria archaeon]|nr:hypothetical protein [Nitrososphaeria archaeon]
MTWNYPQYKDQVELTVSEPYTAPDKDSVTLTIEKYTKKYGREEKWNLDHIFYLLKVSWKQILRDYIPRHQPLSYHGDPDVRWDFYYNLLYHQQWKAAGKISKPTYHQALPVAGVFTDLFYHMQRGAPTALLTQIWRKKLQMLFPPHILDKIPDP